MYQPQEVKNISSQRGAVLRSLVILLAIGGAGALGLKAYKAISASNERQKKLLEFDPGLEPVYVAPNLVGRGEKYMAEWEPPSEEAGTQVKTVLPLKANPNPPAGTITAEDIEKLELPGQIVPELNVDGQNTNSTAVQTVELVEQRAEDNKEIIGRIQKLRNELENQVYRLSNDEEGIVIKRAWEKALKAYDLLAKEDRFTSERQTSIAQDAREYIDRQGHSNRPSDELIEFDDPVIEYLSGHAFNLAHANRWLNQVLACFNSVNSYLNPTGSDGKTTDPETGNLAIIVLPNSSLPAADILKHVEERVARLEGMELPYLADFR